MYIYQNLKKIRERKKLTQQEIADILHIKQTQYSRYERGAQEIPLHHFITLARYYHISLDELAGVE